MLPPSDDPAPVTVRRYFPASVLLPGAASPVTALVVVTQRAVYVFDEPADPAYVAPYDPDGSSLRQEYEMRNNPAVLATPDGLLYVNRAGGCGCGNPLKTYQPFVPLLSGT